MSDELINRFNVEGVADICHVATSAAFTTDASEAIPRTLAGALSILQSTANAPSVKTVVYTSDSFAVLLPQADKKVTITTSMYNEYAMEAMDNVVELDKVKANAWDPSVAIELVVWAAAKATAEKALWQFVADHRPSFQVATVIPNMNFGPPVDSQPLSSTGLCIPDLLKSEEKPNLYFPAQHFVHVRDCAKLHVAALLDPSQNGERIFACAAPFNWNDVLHILRDIKPDKSIRDDFQDLGRDVSVLPNDAAEQLLRKHYNHGWTSLKETVIQNIQHL